MVQSSDSDDKSAISSLNQLPSCWVSAQVAQRSDVSTGGNAAYAVEAIKKGGLVAMWGGSVIPTDVLRSIPQHVRAYSVQIEEDLYLLTTVPSAADYINHSCDPNVGLYGYSALVALRDIEAGEDICYDYATTDGSPYDEFDCRCGTLQCRRRVTGSDWKIPHLWDKYADRFSPYLQRRIDHLKQRLANDQQ